MHQTRSKCVGSPTKNAAQMKENKKYTCLVAMNREKPPFGPAVVPGRRARAALLPGVSRVTPACPRRARALLCIHAARSRACAPATASNHLGLGNMEHNRERVGSPEFLGWH
jgi:hypothetical protein